MKKRYKIVSAIIAVTMVISLFTGTSFAYDKTYTSYVAGHGHIDTAWQWSYATTISNYDYNTWTNQIALMNSNPTYKFSASCAQQYAWMKEYYPTLFSNIQSKVASGQWDIVGGEWVEADHDIPSGESLVRQLLTGQTFFKNNFNGVKATVGFDPDNPGDLSNFPQIGAKSGLNAWTSTRINCLPGTDHYSTNGTTGYDNFMWQGADGTVLQSYKPTPWYGAGMDLATVNSSLDSANSLGFKKGFFYYGNGDIGGGPTQTMINNATTINNTAGEPTVTFAKMADYFNSLTSTEKSLIPTWTGDLYYNHELGLYTTHGDLKKYNNDNEIQLAAAEKASSIAMWLGAAAYPYYKLDTAWKKVLVGQNHDSLPGCNVDSNVHDMWNDYEVALNYGKSSLNNAMAAMASRADTSATGVPLVVFNTLSYTRSELVETPVTFSSTPTYVKVFDATGAEIPSQITSISGNTANILFIANNVPSVGYEVFTVQQVSTQPTYSTGLTIGSNVIENNYYRVQINTKDGGANAPSSFVNYHPLALQVYQISFGAAKAF